jgi:4-aminobutyrate aminotransferase-like enzyme
MTLVTMLQLMPNIPPYDHYDQRRCCMSPLDQLEWMFKMQTAPSETAAIIIEPILGASRHTWHDHVRELGSAAQLLSA